MSVAPPPRDESELASLVEKAVQAPDCSSDQLPSMAFVIHGVGACENAFKLWASLNARGEGAQIVFLNGCAKQASLGGNVQTVEVDPNMPEHEAFNLGMSHINDVNAIVCLLRDDELPADQPDKIADLWKSHARLLFGGNPNLGSLVCSHGFIDIGMVRAIGTDILSASPGNEHPETRTGDDCCDKYGCGSTEEVYPGTTHRDDAEGYDAARRSNFLKRRFSYLTPGWSASTQWVRKSTWKAVGGFTANMPGKANPFFEVEFQYNLYFNGFAFGQYDCEPRSHLSTPNEHEMWTLSKRFNNSRVSSMYLSEIRKVPSDKLMSLPMVSSYAKLRSDASEKEGRPLQHYDFQYWSPFRSIIERANQRLDIKYLMNKFPLRHGPKLLPPDSSLPTLSDQTGNKITMIILTYKHGQLRDLRENILNQLVEPTSGYAAIIDKVIVVWNGDVSDIPPDIQEFSNKLAAVPVEIVPFASNTLLNRYHPSLLQRVNTQAVAYLDDDDKLPMPLELQLSFSFWRCDVRRATYLEGRQRRPPHWPFNLDDFDYLANTVREHSQFGVPLGSVVSKKWLSVYMSPHFEELQKFVVGHPCKPDDIAFGLMIQFFNRFNGAAPTVVPRVKDEKRTRFLDNVENKETSSVEGMAGTGRWALWRKEALVYVKHVFASFDANWTTNVEECYPHRTTDTCLWEITQKDAQKMLSHLATVCPVI